LSTNGLADNVREFIIEHIDSVEQVEILLLLRQKTGRTWTAESMARELRIAVSSAATRLADLKKLGLVLLVEGTPGEYRYAPRTPALDETVRGLSEAYSERRVTVINLIFSKPIDKIRTFADAFRLRREDDDNDG
jgi:hypothetical protein